jgi:hypothetical protein
VRLRAGVSRVRAESTGLPRVLQSWVTPNKLLWFAAVECPARLCGILVNAVCECLQRLRRASRGESNDQFGLKLEKVSGEATLAGEDGGVGRPKPAGWSGQVSSSDFCL